MQCTRGGRVWLATADSGLFVGRRGRVVPLGRYNPRLHQELIAIAEDKRGFFWLAGRYALSRASIAELEALVDGTRRLGRGVRSLVPGQTDGLGITSFEMDISERCPGGHGGRLWFPGTSGAVVVDPQAVLGETSAPRAHVEEVIIDGQAKSERTPAEPPA
ncbi:MAG: hypothetical protein U0163_05235 [Gemmatimonadaceae bacterium]